METALQASHRGLTYLRISAHVKFGPPDKLPFIVVEGVSDDHERRRKTRAGAGELLARLGYRITLEPGRDTYDVTPLRPVSSRGKMRMIRWPKRCCECCWR